MKYNCIMRSINFYWKIFIVILGLVWFGVCSGSENYWFKVKVVNVYFNSNYKVFDDLILWVEEDYWVILKEFVVKGVGDCEDFVIVKYFELVVENVFKELLVLSYVIFNGN